MKIDYYIKFLSKIKNNTMETIIGTIDNIPKKRLNFIFKLVNYLKEEDADDKLFDTFQDVHEKMQITPSDEEIINSLDTKYVIWPGKWKIADKIRKNNPFALLCYSYTYIDKHGFDYDRNGTSFFKCIGDFAIDSSDIHYPFSFYDFGTNYGNTIPFQLCKYIDIWKTPFTVDELDTQEYLDDFILYLQLTWLQSQLLDNPDTDIDGVKNLTEFKSLLSVGKTHKDYLKLVREELEPTITKLNNIFGGLNNGDFLDKTSSLIDEMADENED